MADTEAIQSDGEQVSVGTRLSSQLYKGFVNYLDDECRTLPSEQLLAAEMSKTMKTSAKKSNKNTKKKFKTWSKRMVYSDGLLKHRSTGKIIIPEMDFLSAIKAIHESSSRHLNVSQTVRRIKSRFTWTSKNFGMNLTDVFAIFSQCSRKRCRERALTFRERFNKKRPNKKVCSQHQVSDGGSRVSEDLNYSEFFDELVFRIHSMRIDLNLCKVIKYVKHSELRESMSKSDTNQFI